MINWIYTVKQQKEQRNVKTHNKIYVVLQLKGLLYTRKYEKTTQTKCMMTDGQRQFALQTKWAKNTRKDKDILEGGFPGRYHAMLKK